MVCNLEACKLLALKMVRLAVLDYFRSPLSELQETAAAFLHSETGKLFISAIGFNPDVSLEKLEQRRMEFYTFAFSGSDDEFNLWWNEYMPSARMKDLPNVIGRRVMSN